MNEPSARLVLDVFLGFCVGLYWWVRWHDGVIRVWFESLSWIVGYLLLVRFGASVAQQLLIHTGLPLDWGVFIAWSVGIPLVRTFFYRGLESVSDRIERQFLPGFWHFLVTLLPVWTQVLVSIVFLIGIYVNFPITLPYQQLFTDLWFWQWHLKLVNYIAKI